MHLCYQQYTLMTAFPPQRWNDAERAPAFLARDEIDLSTFAGGIRSWDKMMATALPRSRPDVFRNACKEGSNFVAKGALPAVIADALNDLAIRHGLHDVLDGDDGIQEIIGSAFNTAEIIPAGLEREPDLPHADAQPLSVLDAGDDYGPIPPRSWLLGNVFCRRFVSSLIAPGGVGKTALRLAQLLSLATGKPLTKEHVFLRCRVLVVSLEDDADELQRRLTAACLHFGIERAELKRWLFIVAPGAAGGKIMQMGQHGKPAAGMLVASLSQAIIDHSIDVVSLDPFVKTHSVEENNNSMIDEVVQVLADLAVKHNIAVDVPHHTSKGSADPGNADRARGASAMKDAARLVFTLSPMTPEEGRTFSISEAERRRLIRMDSAKVNIAPPTTEAKWFKLVGVNIGNGAGIYPTGDEVQTVEPWSLPDTLAGLSNQVLNEILSDIEAGLPDGNRFTDASNAGERAAWLVLEKHITGKSEAACRQIIKKWVKSGLLIRRTYDNPATRKSVIGLWIDNEKRPS